MTEVIAPISIQTLFDGLPEEISPQSTTKIIVMRDGVIKELLYSSIPISNVNNTSDINKPISTAVQTALNLKANSSALGTAAAANTGTGSSNVILGNDARLSDTRTPAAHNQAATTVVIDASGFSGHLTTSDTNVQLLAQKVNDLVISGGGGSTDITGLVPKTYTVNGHALSGNITIVASDLSLATVASTGSYSDLTGKPTIPTVTGSNSGDVTLSTTNGLSLLGQALSLQAATDSVPGALTAADHTTFSGKQAALVSGTNIKTINSNSILGSGDITITGAVAWGNVTGTLSAQTDLGTALAGKVATSVTVNGHALSGNVTVSASDLSLAAVASSGSYSDLTSKPAIPTLTDSTSTTSSIVAASATAVKAAYDLAATKGAGTVTSVTGTAPVASSGGATPAISMAAATTSVPGYLTAADWTTFNGKAGLAGNTFTGAQIYSDQVLSQGIIKDFGYGFMDMGDSGTTTQTLDYTAGDHHRIRATGNFNIALSNLPPSGASWGMLIELVGDGTLRTIGFPTTNWVKSDGSTTTTFGLNGVTMQSANGAIDWIYLWGRDAGTTNYGKITR